MLAISLFMFYLSLIVLWAHILSLMVIPAILCHFWLCKKSFKIANSIIYLIYIILICIPIPKKLIYTDFLDKSNVIIFSFSLFCKSIILGIMLKLTELLSIWRDNKSKI